MYSTTKHLVLLSIYTALNLSSISCWRNNVFKLRIQKQRKGYFQIVINLIFSFLYICKTCAHVYFVVISTCPISFWLWPYLCTNSYLPVKSVMPVLSMPVLLTICVPLLIWPFTFTKKSDCVKINLLLSVISIITILTLYALISQNGHMHSNNSSVIWWRIVWVCLTILWDWYLKR